MTDGFERYQRQMLLPGIGRAGQERLARGHAIVVGCGALGCVSADLLARAGVGRLTLIDRDVVERSNLQRQTLFDDQDAMEGVPKAVAAEARLRRVNPAIDVRGIVADVTSRNAERLLGLGADESVVLDGTDTFATRYLINDVCVKLGRTYVYGGVVGTSGMSATFTPQRGGACLRCVFYEPPAPGSAPTCDTAGVLGASVAMVASAQACDAIKILSGNEGSLRGELVSLDAWTGARSVIDLSRARRQDCPCCGQRKFEFLDAQGDRGATLCGQNAVQIPMAGWATGWTREPELGAAAINLAAIADRLGGVARVQRTPWLLRAWLSGGAAEAIELTLFADGRAIVKPVRDVEHARAIVARYVGG
ncbi:MAG: ThiF family adenylyltransferase [Planctomycetota bacterium]|nr:ThiF family adenylyltransferase [Planctomycetota bacterium]